MQIKDGKALLKRLMILERDVLYRELAGPGEDEFRYIPGERPVLVSAPHGAAHYRNGRLKEEDEYTAALVQYLCDQTSCHGLYLRRQSSNDSNYDRGTQYKLFLSRIISEERIRFVMDLHGASDRHNFGVALGTMNGRSCPDQIAAIVNVFRRHGFTFESEGFYHLEIDGLFTASGGNHQETITRFVKDTLGVDAIQVELASRIRVVRATVNGSRKEIYRGDPAMIERMASALIEVVRIL